MALLKLHWVPHNMGISLLNPQGLKFAAARLPGCVPFQADDTQCPIKVVRGKEASAPELNTVLEVSQEYNEQREGVKHSTMQTVSQIIT